MKVFGFVRQKSAAKFIMVDIMDAFRRLGWDYAWLDMETWKRELVELPIQERREKMDALISKIVEFKPDIMVSYGLEAFHPLFIDIFQEEKAPFFSFFGNTPFLCFFFDFGPPFTDCRPIESIPFIRQMQGSHFLFLCWDRDAMGAMRSKGITNCIYCPMGVNEAVFKIRQLSAAERIKYECDFCFVGGPTPSRIEILESIHHQDLKIFGYDRSQWMKTALLSPHYKYPVFEREELAKIYSASFSTINVTREHGKSSLNMRVFEAMACGSLLLTDDKKDARKLFEPDREILIYGNKKEIWDKADWIVKNREQARRMAQRGRDRIIEDHTYFRRIGGLAPVIDRFIKEFKALDRISTQIADQHLSDALEAIEAALEIRPKPFNTAFLHLIKFHTLKAKGRLWEAKQALADSLKANPHLVAAKKAKAQFNSK